MTRARAATLSSDDAAAAEEGRGLLLAVATAADALLLPTLGFAVSLALFALFILATGNSPLAVFEQMVRGAFGTRFSIQNTLLRAAPLMLTALCTALPARLGLIVIGAEGALVVGGLGAAMTGIALHDAPPLVTQLAMAVVGMLAGALWLGAAGALRAFRGVNETISTLLLTYIAIAILNHLVEGPMRDPESLNKPSTRPIAESAMLESLPGLDVHPGLLFGVLACLGCFVLMEHTVFGFSGRVVGGNPRAARLGGLPVRRLVVLACALGGAAAGLAGMVEVAAVHGKANASLAAGYGYTGILVAFLARHSPLMILPVAVLLGGIGASGGLLQRVFGLPDATVGVLQGILFVVLLASETFRGRPRPFTRWVEEGARVR
ncbi:MAG: ABC transporter permease [Pseudomonadota bacterium]